MSCFFGCFRIKASHSHLAAPQKEIVVSHSRNALSSLFLNDDDSIQKGEQSRNEHHYVVDATKLKNEDKFLKTSGTLPETPTEFKNASENSENISAPYGEEKLIPIVKVEELSLEKQCKESPVADEVCDKSLTGAGSLVVEDSPSSCMTDGPTIRRSSINSVQNGFIQEKTIRMDVHDTKTRSETSSVSPGIFARNVQYRNKNVRLDFDSDESAFSANDSYSGNSYQRSRQTEQARSISVTNASPYPASVNDEIQTPGAALITAIVDMDVVGKTMRVRSQYVHSALNPIEKSPEWKENVDVTSDYSNPVESVKPNNEGTLTSTTESEKGMKHGNQMGDEVSSSSSAQSKPPFTTQDSKNEQFGSLSGEKVRHRRIPSDRPILGMVAAHWNEEDVSDVLPKWWDGNGIPNSTNKYKEDQIISWHATPFEERLEKALSEESFMSQRKPIISGIRSVELDEPEESDTAMSCLDSSARLKSVASC